MFKSPIASPESKKTEASVKSVAKATLATPPKGTQCFKYKHRENQQTVGLTPGGKQRIPLNKYEGVAHNYLRIDGSDRIFSSPDRDSDNLELGDVLVAMKNLRDRTNKDYNMGSDLNHFKAAKIKINECIAILKTFYNEKGINKKAFLDLLNSEINKGVFWNPFGLKEIYSVNGYQKDKACDKNIYAAPIKGDNLLCGKVLFKEDNEMDASQGINTERKEPLDELLKTPNNNLDSMDGFRLFTSRRVKLLKGSPVATSKDTPLKPS